jgi:hypothetical protein
MPSGAMRLAEGGGLEILHIQSGANMTDEENLI